VSVVQRIPILGCLLAALSFSAEAFGQQVPLRPGPDAGMRDLVRFAEHALVEAGVQDYAIAVIDGGRVVERRFSTGPGGAPTVDGATRFDLASIAKPVMAWGVMKLVEAGRIQLDRPIESYLTRWRLPPSDFDHGGVTVRRVLSHTAGLVASTPTQTVSDGVRPPIEWFLEDRRLAVGVEPGTRYIYSGGYDLIELLIEEVSGRPFAEFMRDEVLHPLGMGRTVFGLAGPEDPPLTHTDALGGAFVEERVFAGQSQLVGGLDELTAFALAHLGDDAGAPRGRGVLQPAMIDTLLTPVVNEWSGLGYVLRRPGRDLLTAGHAGGGASLFRVVPATGQGLVIITNRIDGDEPVARIECVWLAWLAGTERRCPVSISYALSGAYQRAGVRGGLAYYEAIVASGDPDYDVGLAALSEFARKFLAAERRDEADTVYRFIAREGSDEAAVYGEVADRLASGFDLAEDRFPCYVGEYRSASGGAVRLERAGQGMTFTMIEPVPGLTGPLRPLSERVFVMDARGNYPIELVFDLTESGAATRVTVRVMDYRISFTADRLAPAPDQVLVGVTVIDGTGAAPIPGQTVEITDGRITAIRTSVPADSATLDVAGSFVTPGLIDVHVHLPADRDRLSAALDSMLRLGITSAREMSFHFPDYPDFLAESDSTRFTRLYWPAFWAGSTFMQGDPRIRDRYARAGHVTWLLAVTDTSDIAAAVRAARESGVTGIKMLSDLEPPLVRAISEAARAEGLRVWSHAAVFPTKPSLVVASGVDVISHAAFFVWEGPAELPLTYNEPHPWNVFGPPAPYGTIAYDDPAIVAVLQAMRERGTILDATLTLMTILSDESRTWAVNLTRLAHEMGIPIATGTDTFSLFDEIEALVNDVGLSPLEALASATSVGSAVIGVSDDFGSLDIGKVADLVVYPDDPSVDITALRRPSHVIRGGKLVRPL
jgi:CubicO group peptidase (beta-lactamase class C family)/imidazolonepropionase-like amidohydrolase